MNVEELKNEGLARELRVTVPAAEIGEKVEKKLAELAKTVRLPGFRPGKVPVAHLRRMYGKQVKAEIVEETLRESMQQALEKADLVAAYEPEVEIEGGEEGAQKVIESDADLAYVMKFEVMPEFDVPEDFSDIEVTRYKVQVPEEDVEEALENVARQFRDFEDKGEDAAAEKGDRLLISFVGRIDGEEFEGGSAQNVPLELGSGQFIPGFEDQLIGAKAGEERIVKVTFPEDYGAEKLAGKEAEFTVTVEAVQAPKDQVVDDEFARKLGLESLEALRERVREQLAAEYEQTAQALVKQEALDALDAKFDFPVPEKLVDYEFEQIWHTLQHQMQENGTTFEDEGTSEEEARKEYREIAERRVRLGLVIGAIGRKAGVDVSQEELQQALIAKAQQYPGQEQQVIEFYQKTPEALVELRAPIFESKVLDHILSQAKVEEKEITPEELKKIVEEEEESGNEKPKGTAKKSAKKSAKKTAKKTAGKTTKKPAKKASGKADKGDA